MGIDRPKYIFGSEKHTYTNSGHIFLPIALEGLPSTVAVEGVKLRLQESFHVTILSVKMLIKKYGSDIEEKTLSVFTDFVAKNKVELESFKDEFRFVERKDGRKTLIVMVDISNFGKLFDELRASLSKDIPTQPAHITLYTLNPNEPIGLNDQDMISKMTKITKEVPRDIRKVFGFA